MENYCLFKLIRKSIDLRSIIPLAALPHVLRIVSCNMFLLSPNLQKRLVVYYSKTVSMKKYPLRKNY